MQPPIPGSTRLSWSARHFRWTAGSLLALTIYGSLLPFHYTPHTINDALAALRQVALYPTADLDARGDWAISAVQFTILCFLCMGAIAVDRRPRVGWVGATIVLSLCLALAVIIEFLQVFFPPRTVSLNDIIVETVGGFVGVVLWLVAGQRISRWLRRFGKHANAAALSKWLLPGYLLVVLIVQLMPFDFVFTRDELAVKFNEGKVHLIPFAGPWDTDAAIKLLLNIACFLPLGFLSSLSARTQRPNPASISGLALAVPAVVECLQMFVYSRSFAVTDILTGTAGVALGRWLAQAWGALLARSTLNSNHVVRGTPARWAILVALWLLWLSLLVYLRWRPFDFASVAPRIVGDPDLVSPEGLGWLPFVDYYWGSKYNALDQFIHKSLLFMPLGVLVAFGSRELFPRRRIWLVLLLALIIGGIVEIGRRHLPSHAPSMTDILIGCCGAAVGYRLTQQFRALLWAEAALYGWMN